MFSVATLLVVLYNPHENITFVCVIFHHPLSLTIVLLYVWWHVMLGIDWSAMYTNLIPLYVVINEGIWFLPHHKHKHYFWAIIHDLRHACDVFLSLRKYLNKAYINLFILSMASWVSFRCVAPNVQWSVGLLRVCKLFLPIPPQIETHHKGPWIRRIPYLNLIRV